MAKRIFTGGRSDKDHVRMAVGELMKVEAEAKERAPEGKHSRERKTCFFGYRVRKLHSRIGTVLFSHT